MRLVAPPNRAPASVNRYLLPYEQDVVTIRRHPAVLIGPVAAVLGALIIAGILSNTVVASSAAVLAVIWWVWLLILVWFVWRVAGWSVDYFVITSQRLLLTQGLITRQVNMMPLGKVTDMRFERTLLGRFLGYGTFVMESAGQDQALSRINFVPYPEQLYLEVVGLIFKDPNE
ncbi:PH domain-containing protein [Streptomonospora nanhaiensis]|uniref:Putative membrane protein YdbT with pleckstrin-like domain n=1 Tax=Streptomonospora nanhaiensis TaxID=1323731 RepID=A0A853BQQ2_9ACTN|nr:PH domain-containing protein [Streptomonospora nanhaiensis]MBV2364055.1 PH domain-containing protein [Streptomonospora nanhaiensis]MBX9388661.1 PH domain-containing protein [Streptomonospora nanhaiensis]NYI97055.1 putative membrane protein YdbT with pleckstrin-like domain [Streptomonospora nanhaiensis]